MTNIIYLDDHRPIDLAQYFSPENCARPTYPVKIIDCTLEDTAEMFRKMQESGVMDIELIAQEVARLGLLLEIGYV